MKKILETDRIILRKFTKNDIKDLSEILQDEKVMYAYEHAFSDEEVIDWLNRNITRYKDDGIGLWAIIDKNTNEFVGQAGLTMQDTPDGKVMEIGYLLKRKYWHRGYATEAAIACKEYAFTYLSAERVTSIIRDNNIASQAVAERVGMTIQGSFTKFYHNVEMPHIIFAIDNHDDN